MTVKLTEIDHDRLREMHGQGLCALEIAANLGVSEQTVYRLRIKFGLTKYQPRVPYKVTPEWKAKVQQLLDEGYSHRGIAQVTGCTARTVATHFPGTAWGRQQISEMGKATQMLNRIGAYV